MKIRYSMGPLNVDHYVVNDNCLSWIVNSLTWMQYGLGFYLQYLARWPEYFQVAESPSGEIMGYSESQLASARLLSPVSKWSIFSHGEVGGTGRVVARSRDRTHCCARVSSLGTGWQPHGRFGRDIWKVRVFLISSIKINPAMQHSSTKKTVWHQLRHDKSSARLSLLYIIFCRKHCFFVDLFVRVSNVVATSMYERLGYTVYRTVIDYYSGEKSDEDAYGKLHDCSVLYPLIRCCSRVNIQCLAFSLVADMRKALSADENKQSVIPLDHPVRPEDVEWP